MAQFGKLCRSLCRNGIVNSTNGECDQKLVGVQSRVFAPQKTYLEVCDRLKNFGRDQIGSIINTRKRFECIEECSRCRPQKARRFARNNGSIRQFNSGCRSACCLSFCSCGNRNASCFRVDSCRLHQKLEFINFVLRTVILTLTCKCRIIATNDFFSCGIANGIIIHNAVTCHINAHIGGRFIRRITADTAEHCIDYGKNFHVAVIVNGCLTVGFQVEGVDHIHIVQVCRSRLVCHIDGMLEGKIPNGKGFEFCISRTNTAFAIVVKLAHANRHLSATGTGCGNNHKGARGFNIVVFAVSLIAYDTVDIGRITLDFIVTVHTYAKGLQTSLEFECGRLISPTGKNNTSNHQSKSTECIDQTQNIKVIGNTKVTAHLILFNIRCTDNNNDLGFIFQLCKHAHLAIGGKSGKHA